MYVIAEAVDYADEFDYPIVSVFNEKQFLKALRKLEEAADSRETVEVYFGTNEFLEFRIHELQHMVHKAEIFSPETAAQADHWFGRISSGTIDIVQWILERL